MKVEFRSSFTRDLRRIRDKSVKERVRQTIERIEAADTLQEMNNIKKLRGGQEYYRVRIGDHRLGFLLEQDTVVFVRCLHRRDIYRYFP